MFAARRNIIRLKQLHHAKRRTRHEAGLTAHQFTRIHRVKTVYILLGINQSQNARLVKPFRQRQLHQNAMYLLIRIQRKHRSFQLFLCAAFRQPQNR